MVTLNAFCHKRRFWLLSLFLFGLLLAACGGENPSPSVASPTAPAATHAPSPTPVPPSSTPEPLAARVNGEAISMEQFQAELERYQAAVGTELATEDQQKVLNDLIDQVLLAQGAAEAGFKLEDSALQGRIDELTDRLGGPQALQEWMQKQGYSEADFRQDLGRSIATAWMRDRIASQVPETAEHVHIQQILLTDPDRANETLAQLRSGADFTALAAEVDPLTRGDLGWIPRAYLLDPKLEEAAFSLQVDETSEVIQTAAGYHILHLIERDPEHPLAPEARLALQAQALQDWLEEQRSQAEIEILSE